MTTAYELDEDLRTVIRQARRDPARWGSPKGLSQAEAAARAGISEVWARAIEKHDHAGAKLETIANLCDVLQISPKTARDLNHPLLAVAIQELVDARKPKTAEAWIRETPQLDRQEVDLMLEALREVKRLTRRKTSRTRRVPKVAQMSA